MSNKYLEKIAEIEQKLLNKAEADEFLTGYVHPDKVKSRTAISHKGKTVGFMTPREVSKKGKWKGVWRTGAIYVDPKYRGKGVASKAIKDFYKDGKKGMVRVDVNNASSRKAFEKAGFKVVEGKDKVVDGDTLQMMKNF